jgi:acetoacetyl-CoA reductase
MSEHIALVTGGTGGLGTTISTKLHDRGYIVVITYYSLDETSPRA